MLADADLRLLRDNCRRTRIPSRLHAYGAKAAALFGGAGVDILVNNGGVSSRSAAMDTTLATDERVMAINYTAPVALSKSVLPSKLHTRAHVSARIL